MNGGSFFSGIGAFDYGLHLAGIRHLWGCETDPYRRGIWEQRFRARCHADIRELRGGDLVPVEVCAGGFPCKGASTAGRREGFGHPETVLWREMARVVGELRPRFVVVENVANILALHDGAVWGEVLGDLAAFGYDVEWDCFPAAAFGAPHLRDRVFAVACHAEVGPGWANGEGLSGPCEQGLSREAGGWGARGSGGADSAAAPDSSRDGEGRTGTEVGTDGERAGPGDHVAADSESGGGQGARAGGAALGGTQAGGGVAVDWGEYEPAIRRWEAVCGPAPEPLVRGVDDRAAARVVRSRLSACGDGVLVQAGWFVGRRLMDFAAARNQAERSEAHIREELL